MEIATEHLRPIRFVGKFCAHLGEEEITAAEKRLAAYMKIMIEIFERVERK
jgi:hypothetical protein